MQIVRDDLANGKNVVPKRTVYVPLQFWFCRNPGLSLPIIALQDHDVRVNVELNDLTDLFYGWDGGVKGSGVGTLPACSIWAEYVYLDTDERRRFSQARHEYLIEQLQTSKHRVTGTTMRMDIPFSHPVKELIWTVQDDRWVNSSTATGNTHTTRGVRYDKEWHEFEAFSSTDLTNYRRAVEIKNGNPVTYAQLYMNGQDRFPKIEERYFNQVQPFSCHTNIPKSRGINVYSFALRPEDHQPSGTCNFSKIDNALLELTLANSNAGTVKVYATNYNVLKIMGGMASIAYSG